MSFHVEPPGHATAVVSGRAICKCGWTFDPGRGVVSPAIKAWEHRTGLTYNEEPAGLPPVCPICFALMPERGPERHLEWHGQTTDVPVGYEVAPCGQQDQFSIAVCTAPSGHAGDHDNATHRWPHRQTGIRPKDDA